MSLVLVDQDKLSFCQEFFECMMCMLYNGMNFDKLLAVREIASREKNFNKELFEFPCNIFNYIVAIVKMLRGFNKYFSHSTVKDVKLTSTARYQSSFIDKSKLSTIMLKTRNNQKRLRLLSCTGIV